MTTIAKERINTAVTYAVGQVVIALTVGLSYFTMTIANKSEYLTGLAAIANFADVRWANLLRAAVLYSPGATIGITTGAYQSNLYLGKGGSYFVMPLINLVVGFAAYNFAKKIGHSLSKDMAVAGVYGLIMGVFVSLNLAAWAAILTPTPWSKLLTAGIAFKILTHAVVPMLGVLVYYGFKGLKNEKNISSK